MTFAKTQAGVGLVLVQLVDVDYYHAVVGDHNFLVVDFYVVHRLYSYVGYFRILQHGYFLVLQNG